MGASGPAIEASRPPQRRRVVRRWRLALTPSLTPSLALALAITSAASGCLRFVPTVPADAPADARWIDLDGVRTRYRDDGQGPAVLLIHGFAASLDTWTPLWPALQPGRRLIAMDLKGFGYSSRPAGAYDPRTQAGLLLRLLDARGVEQVDVVAHSWGSAVALQLVALAPQRVRRLALYDAWVFEDQLPPFFLWARLPGLGEALVGAFYRERAEDRMDAAFYAPERVPLALVEHAVQGIERPGTRAAHLAAIRGQRLRALEPGYAAVQQPTLLLWGRDDRVTPLWGAERLLRTLPAAQLRVYPRCGHFPMIEARSESTRDLLAFLDQGPRS